MRAIEYLKEQNFCYDHFTKLTGTGISPNNDNIAKFAENYYNSKSDLLTYKNWQIEKADYGYYEATNLIDCDASMIHAKTIEKLIIEIYEKNEHN